MAYPDDAAPDPSGWFVGFIGAPLIKQYIIDPLNALRNIGRGIIDSVSDSASLTLATNGTNYIGGAAVTWTVPTGGRKYRVRADANFNLNSGTFGRFLVGAAYNPGTSIDRNATTKVAGGTVVSLGARPRVLTQTGGPSDSQSFETVASLPAGTYTASVLVQESSGGGSTDTAQTFTITVYDVGAA